VPETVAVTIPVYKENINADELKSLNQCLKILGSYPVIFFAPEELDTAFYEAQCNGKVEFRIERFAGGYFTGTDGYNHLMLNPDFYRRFADFKFILIYQLDAYVFKDELTEWCQKNYDYIGAPYIFVDLDNYPAKVLTKYRRLLKTLQKFHLTRHKFRHVGNGGFSLRKVGKTIRFLTTMKRLVKKWPNNEDSFFTYYGNVCYPFFRLAPEDEALQFSFEDRPAEAFEINHHKIPFGCHAWQKYGPDFWKQYMDA